MNNERLRKFTVNNKTVFKDLLEREGINKEQKEKVEMIRRMMMPTFTERLEDWYLLHIQYHWVVWFEGFHDDCENFEQRLAKSISPFNKGCHRCSIQTSKEEVLNEIRMREKNNE